MLGGIVEYREYATCGTGCTANEPYLIIQINGAQITSLSTGGASGETRLMENISITYNEVSYLDAHPDSFDLCTRIDVLTCFGDLHAIVLAATRALRAGGWRVFSVGKSARPGSHLHPTGRYSHHSAHVRAALADAALMDVELIEAMIRSEADSPVIGLIVSARRPA